MTSTFTLEELEQAFHLADCSQDYDILRSNCGTFALSFADKLGYEVDSNDDLMDFVIGELANSKISSYLKTKYSVLAGQESVGLIKRMVKNYVQEFMNQRK